MAIARKVRYDSNRTKKKKMSERIYSRAHTHYTERIGFRKTSDKNKIP